jgi:hypothetical protein
MNEYIRTYNNYSKKPKNSLSTYISLSDVGQKRMDEKYSRSEALVQYSSNIHEFLDELVKLEEVIGKREMAEELEYYKKLESRKFRSGTKKILERLSMDRSIVKLIDKSLYMKNDLKEITAVIKETADHIKKYYV